MPTSTVELYSYNILEDGTTTVSGASNAADLADTGYPITRLSDWSDNLYWKWTGSDWMYFQVDQGATSQTVDTLWVANHNFNGLDCYWEYSTDATSWTTGTSWTQGDSNSILKTLGTAQTKQYWRLTVSGTTNPQVGELIMSDGNSFEIQVSPDPTHTYDAKTIWTQSVGGQVYGIKLATKKKRIGYSLRISDAVLATMDTVITNSDDFIEPMLVRDRDDNYFLMRFDRPPTYRYINPDLTDVDLNLIEVV